MTIRRLFLIAAGLCVLLPAHAVAADVVVSIKPLHSLAASVMQGVDTPRLLVSGAASPHSFALRPSDAAALRKADLIVWIGPDLETALERSLSTLARPGAVLSVLELPGLRLLEAREGGVWDEHADSHDTGHEHKDGHAKPHGHHEDPHVWLDPANAKVIAMALAGELARIDPANASRYRANAEALGGRLDTLHEELAARTRPLRGIGYIVFHDAYQYFEASYGLEPAGSITVSPERQPGARRVTEIRDTIVKRKVRCVFAEPQFEPRLQQRLVEATGAKAGVLDPLGATLPEGPALYFTLMRGLATALSGCLQP